MGEAFPIRETLSDGTPVLIRPVEPGDKDLLEHGLEELSEESRYRRFLAPLDHLTRRQLEYLTEVDGVNHVALLARADRDGVAIGGGVARFIRSADDPDTAEAAITVTDAIQGLGLGTRLWGLLMEEGRRRGVRTFLGYLQKENAPVRALLDRFGATYRMERRLVRAEVPLG